MEKKSYRDVAELAKQMFGFGDRVQALVKAGDREQAFRLLNGEFRQLSDQIDTIIEKRLIVNQQQITEKNAAGDAEYEETREALIAAVAVVAAGIGGARRLDHDLRDTGAAQRSRGSQARIGRGSDAPRPVRSKDKSASC